MKLSDYVIEFLVEEGIQDIFLVSGGGIMHLLDSVGRNTLMNYYCNYHEQACAISAEGYARAGKGLGVALVTTGPGALNALSGIVASWMDSIPILIISGQVRRDLIADYARVRQIGPQEGNVIEMAKPVTKYAKTILDPQTIRFELEYSLHAASSGRPGPVWLELPLDIQASQIDVRCLKPYVPTEPASDRNHLAEQVQQILRALKKANRPIFMFGNGIKRAGAQDLVYELLEIFRVPVVLPMTAKDLVEENHAMQMGVFGPAGQRRANFALQNSDCLVSLGVGLNIAKTGFNFKTFAPKAQKIIIDIDEGQLWQQAIKPDIAIQCDAGAFLKEALRQGRNACYQAPNKWLSACAQWKRRYPTIQNESQDDEEHVNSYVFMDKLSDLLIEDDIVVTGNGLDCASYFQAFKAKRNQTGIVSGWGAMGWDLPLAIGACIAKNKAKTVCATGDGSVQWNIQELLTIKHYNLPIKIFVLNNRGYTSIRTTQTNFFEGRFVGADYKSGIDNPDYQNLAAAYNLDYARIGTTSEMGSKIEEVLSSDGPVICEVNIAVEQEISPKTTAFRRADGTLESRPLEDMAPFLSREELSENMHMFDEEDEILRKEGK